MDKKKSISVKLSKNVRPKEYKMFLASPTEDHLILQFATKEDTGNESIIHVKEIIQIPADNMLQFASAIIQGLIDYESQFKNGKGLPSPEEVETSLKGGEDA